MAKNCVSFQKHAPSYKPLSPWPTTTRDLQVFIEHHVTQHLA